MPTISNLPYIAQLTTTTLFPVVDVNTSTHASKKVAFNDLAVYISGLAAVKTVNGKVGNVVLTATDIGGFAAVAISGDYRDLSNTYTYTLPVATTATLGGIKVGDNLTIDGSGRLNGVNSYVLPAATTSTLGGVKVGKGLSIDVAGLLSLTNDSQIYTGDTPPLNASTGTLWYDSVGGMLYIQYDGTWVDTNPNADGGGGGNASIVIADTPPTSASTGTMWYDDVGGHLYIKYDNTWVDTSPPAATSAYANVVVSSTTPSDISTGTLWWDDVSGKLFINYEHTWIDTTVVPGTGSGSGLPFNDGDFKVNWTPSSSYAFPYPSINGITIGSSSATVTRGNTVVGFESGVYIEQGFTFTGAYYVWGINNTLLGSGAGNKLTRGNENTFIGHGAGASTTNSNYNTYIGYGSGYGVAQGSFNTTLGWNALGNLRTDTISSNNLALGADAGSQLSYGNGNVIIGSYNGITLQGSDYHVVLSDGNGDIKMFWDDVGNSRHYGILHIGTDTNAVASTGSGALRVDGGVGIGLDLWVGGDINATTIASRVFALELSATAPRSVAGMFAVADGVNWDPASKASGSCYPVFYDGSAWNALY